MAGARAEIGIQGSFNLAAIRDKQTDATVEPLDPDRR